MSDSDVVSSGANQPQAQKGFVARVLGVFFSPAETFEDIARKPTIWAPLLLLVVVQGFFLYAVAPAQGQDAAAFTERSSFLQRLPEEQRAAIIEQQRNPSPTRRLISAATGPLVVVLFMVIAALIFWGAGNLLGGQPTFKKTLSMVLFASMITLVLGQLVKLPLILTKNTVAGVTFSPAMLMPDLEVTSTQFRLWSLFDLFALWGTVVTGIGLAKVSAISTAKGVVTSFVLYAVIAGVGFAIGSLFL
jgi:hypothetical protein